LPDELRGFASLNRKTLGMNHLNSTIGSYVCEVRYGGATANALQRGLWTNTKNGLKYFDRITNGWVNYAHNLVLAQLFSHALVSSSEGHEMALEKIKEDIARLKKKEKLA